MDLVLTTQFDKRFIKLSWGSQPLLDVPDVRHSYTQRIIDTEEAAVRAALIEMGWTPPEVT